MRKLAMRLGLLLIAAMMLPVDALAQSQLVIPQVTVAGQLQRWTGMTLGGKFVGTVAVVDASGNQITLFGNGANIGATGSAVPASANFNGINVSGNLRGVTGLSLGSAFAPTIAIVDGSGNPITSFGGSGGTASNFGSAFPSSGTSAGFSDGTNMQGARVFDGDSGAGTQYVLGAIMRKTASGGTVEAGTSSDPLRVDPTGSTTQPVSGTVTANQGGTWTVQPGNTANTTPWLQIIRDAAGNARGANVDASNRLNTAPSLVSASVASGAYASGSIASGAMVDVGAQADAVCATDTGTCSLIALTKKTNANTSAAVAAGTNIIGKVGIDQTTPGTTNAVSVSLSTAGGPTPFFLQPAASDNHTVVKAGAGQVYYVVVTNNSATVNYLRFYNATTGFNGCNSATNHVAQIAIPASTSVGGISIPFQYGLPFATGISICVTSGYALTDTTNATASAMSLTIGYN